jgi:hypothetical protein
LGHQDGRYGIGRDGGDALSVTMNLGYASAVSLSSHCSQSRWPFSSPRNPFILSCIGLSSSRRRLPARRSRTFADRSLGNAYFGGSLVLLTALMAVLGLWRFSVGSVSVNQIVSPKAEGFCWATILFSNTPIAQ